MSSFNPYHSFVPLSEAHRLQSNFIEITLRYGGASVNLLLIFRTPFPRITFGGLLLQSVSII